VILGTGIGVEGLEGKHGLIKNNVSRDIDAATGDVETFESIVHITISKEHTLGGPKLEFMRIVWVEIRPTGAAKDSKTSVVWSSPGQLIQWSIIRQKFSGSTINNKVSGCKKSFIPIF
jgi:hypothetical protein